jgi:hypothetical protein
VFYLEMLSSVELLIEILEKINADERLFEEHIDYFNKHPLVNAAKYLANECLIGEDGHPCSETIDIVIKAGFRIFPGERDRFGWLTGCIQLHRGFIIFG